MIIIIITIIIIRVHINYGLSGVKVFLGKYNSLYADDLDITPVALCNNTYHIL